MSVGEGWAVVFTCPACQEQTTIRLAIPRYWLMTGPSLTCAACGAIIAVRLEVAIAPQAPSWPGPGVG